VIGFGHHNASRSRRSRSVRRFDDGSLLASPLNSDSALGNVYSCKVSSGGNLNDFMNRLCGCYDAGKSRGIVSHTIAHGSVGLGSKTLLSWLLAIKQAIVMSLVRSMVFLSIPCG
jgi:hypothetical protein